MVVQEKTALERAVLVFPNLSYLPAPRATFAFSDRIFAQRAF